MLHMKEEKGADHYDPVEVSSVVDISPSEFAADNPMSTGLSPRRDRKAHQRENHASTHKRIPVADIDLNPYDDDVYGDDSDMYDSEGKPRTLKHGDGDDGHNDARFRVNGIAVDREVQGGAKPNWEHAYQILFQSSTPTGQRVALILLIMVSLSIACAVLDSVKSIREDIGQYLLVLEIFFTIVFSIEYALRVACLRTPRRFMLSLLGVVDLCALVPSYLGFFIPSARPLIHLAVLRIFRVMRVFRILRLARFVDASAALSDNIQSNKRRILVFLVGLFTLILVIGCAMYLIEGDRHDFSNIPISLYWAVVTITTVGYGDIAPQTILGRMLATVVMFVGYGIIACPLVLNQTGDTDTLTELVECPRCFRRMHQEDANFCRVCGTALRQPRAKIIKARRRDRLRLAKLNTPLDHDVDDDMDGLTPSGGLAMSTTSTSKSSARLLPDEVQGSDKPVHL